MPQDCLVFSQGYETIILIYNIFMFPKWNPVSINSHFPILPTPAQVLDNHWSLFYLYRFYYSGCLI